MPDAVVYRKSVDKMNVDFKDFKDELTFQIKNDITDLKRAGGSVNERCLVFCTTNSILL